MVVDIKRCIETYRQKLSTYEAFAIRIESLLNDLLRTQGVKIHFTESRAKSPESLAEKLSRPGKSYSDPLAEVSDLVGVRLVLYYQDDITKIGELIKREFTVIKEEHEHQPEKYAPDQFGYLSVHYIVSLGDARAQLTEWKEFISIRAEIQVRTVLQHSWAAVSHALQYKREGDVPIGLRRKLFRLAGLFELADEEFVDIRHARDSITRETRKAVQDERVDMPIDAPVVREIIRSSSRFKAIMSEMREMGYTIKGKDDVIGSVVEECDRLGLNTLEDLEKVMYADYRSYLEEILGSGWRMPPSFVLYLLLIAWSPDAFSKKYLLEKGWSPSIANVVIKGSRGEKKA